MEYTSATRHRIGSWEKDINSSHVIEDVTVENNYILYSGFESPYNAEIPMEEDTVDNQVAYMSRIGYISADSMAFRVRRGGENYKIVGNTFAFAVGQLIHTEEMDVPKAPHFEGNTYAQLPGFAARADWNSATGAPLVRETDMDKVVSEVLKDEKATIITFE